MVGIVPWSGFRSKGLRDGVQRVQGFGSKGLGQCERWCAASPSLMKARRTSIELALLRTPPHRYPRWVQTPSLGPNTRLQGTRQSGRSRVATHRTQRVAQVDTSPLRNSDGRHPYTIRSRDMGPRGGRHPRGVVWCACCVGVGCLLASLLTCNRVCNRAYRHLHEGGDAFAAYRRHGHRIACRLRQACHVVA